MCVYDVCILEMIGGDEPRGESSYLFFLLLFLSLSSTVNDENKQKTIAET